MATKDVEDALDRVPPGTRVRLKMRDGAERYAVTGVERTLTTEGEHLAVDLDDVERIVVSSPSTD